MKKLLGLLLLPPLSVMNLGPGLLESAYKACLLMELEERGLHYKQEILAPIIYKNKQVDCGFRIDVLVADTVVVELKSVEHILSSRSYLSSSHLFAASWKTSRLSLISMYPILKQGIRRCVLRKLPLRGISPCPLISDHTEALRARTEAQRTQRKKIPDLWSGLISFRPFRPLCVLCLR